MEASIIMMDINKETSMAYTVSQLAKLSGVTVRTLQWYDRIGLLKPTYYGANSYRYYEEKELLLLQQILFFRELGFELKKIKNILGRSDFDILASLTSHRSVLVKNQKRIRDLLKTIDKTIEHLKGKQKMEEQDFYHGFSKEQQSAYEKQLIDRFGQEAADHIAESKEKMKSWTKEDFQRAKDNADSFMKKLKGFLEKELPVDAPEVQDAIREHHEWIKQFWTPTKESYASHGKFIMESDLRKAYARHHVKLPEFVAAAIQHFAEYSL